MTAMVWLLPVPNGPVIAETSGRCPRAASSSAPSSDLVLVAFARGVRQLAGVEDALVVQADEHRAGALDHRAAAAAGRVAARDLVGELVDGLQHPLARHRRLPRRV